MNLLNIYNQSNMTLVSLVSLFENQQWYESIHMTPDLSQIVWREKKITAGKVS